MSTLRREYRVLLVYLEKDSLSKDLDSPSSKVSTGGSVGLTETNGPSHFLEDFIKGI